jgi:glycosyltransferase involved in cell wall biosynthesis
MTQVGLITQKRMLMVADVDLRIRPNHRFFHIVDYFSSRFREVDFVSYANLYGGPPASLPKKVAKTIHNLLYDRRRIHREGNVRHIVIRRLKLPQSLQNLLGDLWAYVNLPEWLKHNHYDLCLYSHPHNVFLVSLLKRFKVVEKIIYDDCDFFPDHLDATGRLSSAVLSWKERLAVTRADGVVSVSEPLARLRRDQGARNVIVVPNGIALDDLLDMGDREPHPPTLIYIGGLREAWGIDLVLKALPLIKREIPDIRFIIVGSGEYMGELENLAMRLGLRETVTFCGEQPHDELSKYLRQADVGVATYKVRRFVHYASPLKIREYMAAGLPVITSRIGQAEEIVKASGAGQLVDGSPTSIASAAVKILSDQELCEEYSTNAVRYAASLDWGTVLRPVLDFTVSA